MLVAGKTPHNSRKFTWMKASQAGSNSKRDASVSATPAPVARLATDCRLHG